MPASPLLEPLLHWYARQARSLPWRLAGTTAWEVLVSEVMLQQTPVARVLPVYRKWVERWPTPAALSSAAPGDAVRMWGGLGYPRRALRLHATATVIERDHGGCIPSTYEQLLTLPGIGDYTAAAISAFAFSSRTVVLDTNVRRVLARVASGREHPPRAVHVAERRLAQSLLPEAGAVAARWNVALMELGATVCTARAPRCDACPVSGSCAWRRAGYPRSDSAPARVQRYAGTDRQARGRILAMLRGTGDAVPRRSVACAWPDSVQRERALQSLLADGLVVEQEEGALALPG